MEQSTKPTAFYPADIDKAGGVLLPAELRQLMNIEIGDEVAWVTSNSGLRLLKTQEIKKE